MLRENYTRGATGDRPVQLLLNDSQAAMIDFRSIKRHSRLIAAVAAFFMCIAFLYLMLRPTWYTASTSLIIDHRSLQLTQENSVFTTSMLPSPLVESQVEVLRSQRIAAGAVGLLSKADQDALLAMANQEALLERQGPLSQWRRWIGLSKDQEVTEEQTQTALTKQLQTLTVVRRIGETFSVEIAAYAPEPGLAARLATATSDAYLAEQAEDAANAAAGASPWLRERLRNSGTTARVISKATAPLTPSGPRTAHILLAFLVIGLAVGVVAAFLRDFLDTRIRTPEQAANVAMADWLGVLPMMQSPRPLPSSSWDLQSALIQRAEAASG